jgi:hypothetical protein
MVFSGKEKSGILLAKYILSSVKFYHVFWEMRLFLIQKKLKNIIKKIWEGNNLYPLWCLFL